MSSSDNCGRGKRRRAGLLLLATLGASLTLAGCLRPLYGPTVGGGNVADKLASVEVAVTPVPSYERLTHYLEQDLRFTLDGSGRTTAKVYRLEVSVRKDVVTSSINQTTGQAVAAIVRLSANYKLVEPGSARVLTSGSATASAGYDRTPQRFADLRADRNAELRATKVLAEQLQTRLASWFARGQ